MGHSEHYSRELRDATPPQHSAFPSYGTGRPGSVDGPVGWAPALGLAVAVTASCSRGRAWSLDGVWLSRYADWRRTGCCPWHMLALCGPVAHRAGGAHLPRRAAGAAIDDAG